MPPRERRLRAAGRAAAAHALVPHVGAAATCRLGVRRPAAPVIISSVQRCEFFRTELFEKLLRAEPSGAGRVVERFGGRPLGSLVEGARTRPFRFVHEAELVYLREASLEDALRVRTGGRSGRRVVQHAVGGASAGRRGGARRGGGELRFEVCVVGRVHRQLVELGPALAIVALVEGGRARAAHEGTAALGGGGVVLVEAEGAAQRRPLAARPARLVGGGVRERRARRRQQAVQRQAAARAARGCARRQRGSVLRRRGQRRAATELDEPEFVLEFALSLLFIHVFI